MTVHNRRLKTIVFDLDGSEFQCQVKTWKLDPGAQDGDRMYSFCNDPDPNGGAFIEETDDEPVLELTFFSDWRSAGISRFLWNNNRRDVPFQLDHHPGITGEHMRWTGVVKIKAPAVGGEARATEETEVTLQIVGEPIFDDAPV